jgi:hypothetical protein
MPSVQEMARCERKGESVMTRDEADRIVHRMIASIPPDVARATTIEHNNGRVDGWTVVYKERRDGVWVPGCLMLDISDWIRKQRIWLTYTN